MAAADHLGRQREGLRKVVNGAPGSSSALMPALPACRINIGLRFLLATENTEDTEKIGPETSPVQDLPAIGLHVEFYFSLPQ